MAGRKFYSLLPLLYFLVGQGIIGLVTAEHFYGATVSWKPVNGTRNAAEFSFKVGFKYKSVGSGKCDESTIGGFRKIQGDWTCQEGCLSRNEVISPLDFYCTAIDSRKTFEQGENKFSFIFPTATAIIRYEGFAWRRLNYGKGASCPFGVKYSPCGLLAFNFTATVDLRSRNDTGRPNSSPLVISRPTYNIQYKCDREIKLLTSDPDGDTVKCRWSKGSDECANVCRALPGTTLDEETCTLNIAGSTSNDLIENGWYAVAIQIEDYARTEILFKDGNVTKTGQPLTSIPLQFLVNIFDSNDSCESTLEFLSPTPEDRSTTVLSVGKVYSQRVKARILTVGSGSTPSNLGFTVQGPRGLKHFNVTATNAGLNTSSAFFIEIQWKPNADQIGDQQICFSAEDTVGKASITRCVTIIVSNIDHCASSPCPASTNCTAERNGFRCVTTVPTPSSNISCFSSPCLNGGTCILNSTGGILCLCSSDWSGSTCSGSAKEPGFDSTWKIIVGTSCGLLLLAGIIVVIVLLRKKFMKKETVGPSSDAEFLRQESTERFDLKQPTVPLYSTTS